MKFTSLAALGCSLLLSHAAHAGFKGTIEFSEAEKAQHVAELGNILASTASCVEEDIARHKLFMKRFDVSAFFGDNSPFAKISNSDGTTRASTKEEKRYMLRKAGVKKELLTQLVPEGECKGGLDECPNMMQPTSCIGLAMKCLAKGFRDVGHEQTWQKLRRYSIANGVQGDALLDGLQKLGWKIYYWNPETAENEKWDKKDQRRYPGNPKNVWGQHAASWATVQKKQRYYFNVVDDYSSLVDFGRHPPEWIKSVPFFLGLAHLGYHVFPGTYGDVVEAHSTRPITDKETIERSEFSPGRRSGGPRGGMYLSGIMGVPPGFGPDASEQSEEDDGEERESLDDWDSMEQERPNAD